MMGVMVRIAAWLSASVFVAVAAIATVGFVQDARTQDAPTASECVDDWNARSTGNAQRLVATERDSSARVSGWPTWVLGTPLTHPEYSDFTDIKNWNDTVVEAGRGVDAPDDAAGARERPERVPTDVVEEARAPAPIRTLRASAPRGSGGRRLSS